MPKYSQDKDYIYYHNTNIPINKLNILEQEKLEKEEQKLLLLGYKYFHTLMKKDTIFDEKYYKELHRITFLDLYDFAGKYRNFNVSKGYTTFCQVRFLQQMPH